MCKVAHVCTGLLSTVAPLTSGGGGMPAPGAASLLPQAETAMVIIEASARTASDVRIDARRACPPGAPERNMEGKARGRRVGAIGTFIGGGFPGWVWLSVAVPGRGRRRGRRGDRDRKSKRLNTGN